ncbi:MAG: DUF4259 domain-containing protein [Woeseia sp.]
MGAWGIGHFENDDACDWAYDLEESRSLQPIIDALSGVEASSDYLESPDACIGLAAAEAIAATRGKPSGDLPESVAAIVGEIASTVDASLVARATAAVIRIRADSELKELWEETDDFAEWQSRVDDLLQRLQ